MSIMATMFVKLFCCQCSIALCAGVNAFLLFLQNRKFAKAKKQNLHLNESQKFFGFPMQCATALCSLKIVAILLVNARKTLKFYPFKSVQNLVSFLI